MLRANLYTETNHREVADPVVINFVDFRKAFDSVHRESIWKILKTYGIPTKITDLIKNFYEDSCCAVRCAGELGEWFMVVSGLRQGCVLSPLIFAIVVDWIMSRGTGENTFGLKWTEGEIKAHGSGLRRRHRFVRQHMGWNKAIDGKGPGRRSKGGSYHQPRQDKGHENRKMAARGRTGL